MTTRRPRSTRPVAKRYQVTARDKEIVYAVARMAQATSDQLRRLFFTEPSTAARRLAKLVALRLLDVRVCGQSDPNIYIIGTKGLELLRVEQEVEDAEVHRGRVGRHLDLHLRYLNDVRVELVLGARRRQDIVVETFRSDLDLRRASGAPSPPYIPDALVELKLPSGRLVLVVEVDTGTEGRGVFAAKAQWTVDAWNSGARVWGAEPGLWRPVVFVPSTGRAKALARAIQDVGGGGLWLVGEFDRLVDVGIFGPVFATAADVAATPRRSPVTYRAALVPSSRGVAR